MVFEERIEPISGANSPRRQRSTDEGITWKPLGVAANFELRLLGPGETPMPYGVGQWESGAARSQPPCPSEDFSDLAHSVSLKVLDKNSSRRPIAAVRLITWSRVQAASGASRETAPGAG